ncbi:DUF6787 family protein [Reichenbachiella versicolor]|uniref:DUF6787 family protein n=1 Tax=Reichenbachiella versicolor TaxID=1821036 RepID=UPI000D6E5F85|nr:DUF6787 family protein [Reichenbachiella versicolor]
MRYLKKLQSKWKLESMTDLVIVLIVFASTGFTVMFLKGELLGLISKEVADSTLYSVLYYIFILPIYNLILLFYGLIFGKFKFFWEFELRMWKRLVGSKVNEESK